MSRRGKPSLRLAAEFLSRDIADEAWSLLMEKGVPATLEHTPRSLGQGGYTRLLIPEDDLDAARQLLEPMVSRDRLRLRRAGPTAQWLWDAS